MSRPDQSTGGGKMLGGEVMMMAVIFVFVVFILLFFIYLRAKHYWGACPPLRPAHAHAHAQPRARLIFVPDQRGLPRRGLDPGLIRALPSLVFYAKDFHAAVECAVCLCDLCDGEAARVLPTCSHGFHLECIDMWLHSNSTCPLCRTAVVPEPPSVNAQPAADPWGAPHAEVEVINNGCPSNSVVRAHDDSSSAGETSLRKLEGMLVIEIPTSAPNPLLQSSRLVLEGTRSPTMPAQLRTLTRLFILGSRGVGSPPSHSPRGGDIEQGAAAGSAPATPKTPTNS